MAVTAGVALGMLRPRSEKREPPAGARVDGSADVRASSPAPAPAPAHGPASRTTMAARAGGNARQMSLWQRALAGDGAAALEWLEYDGPCRSVSRYGPLALHEYFDDESPHPATPTRFAQRSADEHEQLSNRAIDMSQREARARAMSDRLSASCDGYRMSDDAERYAMARVAAGSGPTEGLRHFAAEPPFLEDLMLNDGGDAAQLARIRDWSQRVPALLEGHAQRGDAEAALMLGLAYALDGEAADAPPGFERYFHLYSALADDAMRYCGWFARYPQLAPDGAHAAFVRAALAQLAAQLDPQHRAALEREWRGVITAPAAQ